MPKIKKVVATVWYNKKNMHDLRRVFPDAEFCYVDFFDKEKLEKEVKDADVAILMGDVDPCLLGENTLKWIWRLLPIARVMDQRSLTERWFA